MTPPRSDWVQPSISDMEKTRTSTSRRPMCESMRLLRQSSTRARANTSQTGLVRLVTRPRSPTAPGEVGSSWPRGGHKMPNQGDTTLRLRVPDGGRQEKETSSIIQVAAVTGRLWSVSRVGGEGHWVKFIQKDATVHTAEDLLVCTFDRRGWFHVGAAKLRNPRHHGFTRPASP